MQWPIIAFVGIGLFVLSFFYWRAAVFGVLFWVVVEGALRKWVFPDYQAFIYLLKFIALGGAYLRFYGGRLVHRERLIPSHPINLFIWPLVGWGILELFNPHLPNLLVGVFGLEAYFSFVPLFYMVPSLFPSKERLVRFLTLYALVAIPVFIVGIAQFFTTQVGGETASPFVSYLQWPGFTLVPPVSPVVSQEGINYARVSATFSYLSGYGTYVFVIIIVLLTLLNLSIGVSMVSRVFLSIALTLGIANAFMTGSRGVVFSVAALVPIFFFTVLRSRPRTPRALWPAIVLSLLIVFTILLLFSPAITQFWQRTMGAWDNAFARVVRTFATPVAYARYSFPWGYGIGSTHQATFFLASGQPQYAWLPTMEMEEEPGRVMLELGLVGFLLFYAMRLALLFGFWRLARTLSTSDGKVLAMAVFLFHAAHFYLPFMPPIVFNVTASLYYWFFSGMLFLLPQLERRNESPAGPIS